VIASITGEHATQIIGNFLPITALHFPIILANQAFMTSMNLTRCWFVSARPANFASSAQPIGEKEFAYK